MPLWLVTLLTAVIKFLNISRRDVVVALFVLLVCGFGAVLLAQNIVMPFINRIDSQQEQIDSLRKKDVALSLVDSSILDGLKQVQRSANINLMNQFVESPLLTLEERAKINTLMSWSVEVDGDSLSQLIAYRRNLQMMSRR